MDGGERAFGDVASALAMRKYTLPLFVAVLVVASAAWYLTRSEARVQSYRGSTMGSTFAVTWVETQPHPSVAVEVDRMLARITQLMSTYDATSELSAFNRSTGTEWFAVAPELAEVVTIALRTSDLCDGVFDVTVNPLVAAWGFGPKASPTPPSDAELERIAEVVGYRLLSARIDPPALKKQVPGVQVDLNGIAPGYAVDQIAKQLVALGINDYLIDVGGELRAAGKKAASTPWRVAVEVPDTHTQPLDGAFALQDTALATSGDYRNYIERDGKRLAHTIDPRTRRPLEHHLASVTVLAPTAAEADALATALNVWGPDEGLKRAARHEWSVLMVVRTSGGAFEQRKTGLFATQE